MHGPSAGVSLFGAPIEFILFGAALIGVALFHHRTLTVALAGLAAILVYKFAFNDFGGAPGLAGFFAHVDHHWIESANLGMLLVGFAVLARQFEESQAPELIPDILPDNWLGGLALLAIVFVGSAFLDNIAGALIGATIAAHVYRKKVHIGFLAAIVACANAGGAGSVIGDTTTTMMWIAGKSPLDVLHAYAGAGVAFVIVAVPAALIQQRHAPILGHDVGGIKADWLRAWVAAYMLVCVVGANIAVNLYLPDLTHTVPVLGIALWFGILTSGLLRAPDWSVVAPAAKGAAFLLSLVFAASLMPVESLPAPSWQSAFALGAVSAVFDNIPLTALALSQGGYDWGVLAYTVGFGGSMIWFGSSAGVAVSNLFPESRSTIAWLRAGWFVPIAYIVGFFVMLWAVGWNPQP